MGQEFVVSRASNEPLRRGTRRMSEDHIDDSHRTSRARLARERVVDSVKGLTQRIVATIGARVGDQRAHEFKIEIVAPLFRAIGLASVVQNRKGYV